MSDDRANWSDHGQMLMVEQSAGKAEGCLSSTDRFPAIPV